MTSACSSLRFPLVVAFSHAFPSPLTIPRHVHTHTHLHSIRGGAGVLVRALHLLFFFGPRLIFITLYLIPAIRGVRRVLLWDNRSTHFSPEIDDVLREDGHIYVARPPNSPDFSYIEIVFSFDQAEAQGHGESLEY